MSPIGVNRNILICVGFVFGFEKLIALFNSLSVRNCFRVVQIVFYDSFSVKFQFSVEDGRKKIVSVRDSIAVFGVFLIISPVSFNLFFLYSFHPLRVIFLLTIFEKRKTRSSFFNIQCDAVKRRVFDNYAMPSASFQTPSILRTLL